jgi:hypothetical protein
MIRVVLFEREKALAESEHETPVAADACLDWLLTEIHAGKYGAGPFTLTADFFDRNRPEHFLGRHVRLAVPRPQFAAAQL